MPLNPRRGCTVKSGAKAGGKSQIKRDRSFKREGKSVRDKKCATQDKICNEDIQERKGLKGKKSPKTD